MAHVALVLGAELMAKRVGYLISQYPAPSHTFVRREIDAVRRAGVDVDMFSIRPPPDHDVLSDRDREDHDSTWYVLPISALSLARTNAKLFLKRPLAYAGALKASIDHRVPGARSLVWALFYFLEGMKLAKELEARGIEHLHDHFANPAAHAGYAAVRYLGIGWSLTLHGLSDFDYPGGLLLEDKIRAARFVACATKYGRAQAMRLSDPALWERLIVTRCGIELDRIPPRDPNSDRLRFVCVGRLSPEKGQLGLIDAFGAAVDAGLDAELLLVGDGPDMARVEERVQSKHVKDRIMMVGRKAEGEALEAIASSDVLVLASFMEGLPVVLMEALAMEVPVVAPCIAGIPELVEHKKTGLLFAAGDWDDLAQQLLEIGRDEDLRRSLGAEGRKRIVEEFDIDRAVRPLVERFSR